MHEAPTHYNYDRNNDDNDYDSDTNITSSTSNHVDDNNDVDVDNNYGWVLHAQGGVKRWCGSLDSVKILHAFLLAVATAG